MNKFENEQDNNYQSVSREVVRMAQKSVEMSIRGKAEPKMLPPYGSDTSGFENSTGVFPGRVFQLSPIFAEQEYRRRRGRS